MSREHEQPLDDQMQRAITELSGLIQQHYPGASFRVSRGQDDPEAVHLRATVDVDDPDEVVDLIIDRMMALQIEDGLPIFVIPVRPRARVEALREAAGTVAPQHWRPASPL
jgi:hypothetical protein